MISNIRNIRKRVICHDIQSPNNQNLPPNPIAKLSFHTIKKFTKPVPQNPREEMMRGFHTPKTHKFNKSNANDSSRSSREDCNKFSLLLSSKGYSNQSSAAKTKIESINSKIISSKGKKNLRGNKNLDQIQRKCRKIKQKDYKASRQYGGELNSFNKLKVKLFSPIKKSASQTERPTPNLQTVVTEFAHESFQSQLDMVNISKANDESIEFDMSPGL